MSTPTPLVPRLINTPQQQYYRELIRAMDLIPSTTVPTTVITIETLATTISKEKSVK